MSNDHMKHRQCQTCFVDFPTNQDLTQHIETYRSEERLLVARLERCRLHLAHIDHVDDETRDDEDSDHEPIASRQCPDLRCKKQFTTRSNLVRHFQTHVPCFEFCPSCREIFTRIDRYVRHDCNHKSDKTKDIYIMRRVTELNSTVTEELNELQRRATELNSKVTEELNELQCPPRHAKRRAQANIATRPQKIVKTTQTNTSLQSLLSVAGTVASEAESASHSETLKVTAAKDTDETVAEAAAMRPSYHTFHPETTSDTSVNDSRWTSTETAPPMPANDSQWTSSDTVPLMDSGWAFTTIPPAITDENGWAFALPTMPADDWAYAGRPNNGEWSYHAPVG